MEALPVKPTQDRLGWGVYTLLVLPQVLKQVLADMLASTLQLATAQMHYTARGH